MARQVLLALLVASIAGIACATSGAAGGKVAHVPKPFPGAPVPPGANGTTSSTDAPPEILGPPPVAAPEVLLSAPPVVLTALKLRGTPYRNGGSDPDMGFDCSGLVQWVFAQHGVTLPRDV